MAKRKNDIVSNWTFDLNYKKGLEVDPEHTNNLNNYATFLNDIDKD